MIAAIVIALLSVGATIALVLFRPSVSLRTKNVVGVISHREFSIYWVPALIGAVLVVAVGCISPLQTWQGLSVDMFSMFVGESSVAINPIKILILFVSMTVLSVFLDEVGFFAYLASATLKRAGTSQKKLFLYLYLVVSVLTVFTSNDIVILTFTPFVCYFCKNADISPTPYLVAEFVAANTWSMFFIIGNPTNIYLASSFGVTFFEYFTYMALPTLFAGLSAYLVLIVLFKRKLNVLLVAVETRSEIKDKTLLVIGLVHLIACIILLAVSDFIGVEMWFLTLCFAVSLSVCALIYAAAKRRSPVMLAHAFARAPWQLVPFVIGMFVLVLALENTGVCAPVAAWLSGGAADTSILTYGVSSTLAANLVNNIPMSVLYASLVQDGSMSAVYASIIGSNVGAFLTPLGALAGIMFTGILKSHGVRYSFLDFVKYGVVTVLPTLFAALGGLYLSFAIVG